MVDKKSILEVAAMFGKEYLFEGLPEDWWQKDRLLINGETVPHEVFYHICEETGDIFVARVAAWDGFFMENTFSHGSPAKYTRDAKLPLVIPFHESMSVSIKNADSATPIRLGEYTGQQHELRYKDNGNGYLMQWLTADPVNT